ncbi:MAG: hypothetical protein C0518_15955 [Opitutus sp.]|nr:hypothetical protein [Opitutus sp.]
MAGVATLFLSGCVTSKKYRLAKDDTPPAIPLDWAAAGQQAELQVKSVIVFKGPGSWKREARWDEYVVQLKNTGDAPLMVESAELIDLLGAPQLPGSDPWALEKLSYTNWDKYGKTGLKLLAGAGAVVLYAGAVTAVALSSALGGGAAVGGGAALLSVIPIVAVVDIAVVAGMNHANKKKVVEEFTRRRIELPVEVAAGGTREGSFFFPMTPAPKELIVHARRGGEKIELHLPLPELAKLHLKPEKK